MSSPRVLVVGAGITGLAAAWQAARDGARVTLVEAGAQVGGRIRTERVAGLLVEHGPDSFVSFRPAALALVDDLGMADEVITVRGQRAVHLRVDGRLRPLPAGMGMVLPTRLGPFARTRILTWRQKGRAGMDLLMARRLGPEDTSIGAFLRTRLGDGAVERFAEPMVGGIYGAGVDELSLDAVLPSLRSSEREHRSLILASLAQGRSARRDPAGSPFRSLRDGMGSLVDRLLADVTTQGSTVRVGTAVTALARAAGSTRATLSDGTGLEVDEVILAVGPGPMADLLAPHAPDAARSLRGIPLGSTTVVTLALPRRGFLEPPTSQGWLEAGPAPISGVTISSAKWEGRAPEDLVLLRAFAPDRRGLSSTLPDCEVIATVTDHVATVLGFRGSPALTRVTRWAGVMPTYTVGHLDRVRSVETALQGLPGWHAAGSALHGVGIPECIADGRRAARAASSPRAAAPASP
jgi:oxygen-dependent protoporphyrinogen oxidase